MEGINHAQFASGPMPSSVRENDLNPELSAADAYETIAFYSNTFMEFHFNDSDTNMTELLEILDKGYTNTADFLQVILESN